MQSCSTAPAMRQSSNYIRSSFLSNLLWPGPEVVSFPDPALSRGKGLVRTNFFKDFRDVLYVMPNIWRLRPPTHSLCIHLVTSIHVCMRVFASVSAHVRVCLCLPSASAYVHICVYASACICVYASTYRTLKRPDAFRCKWVSMPGCVFYSRLSECTITS